MSSDVKIIGYHGTDLDAAKSIVVNDFKVKKSKEHWLGNGVYFFLDKALARYWCSNPSKRFGCAISFPAIIKAEITCENDNFLDLRCLDSYILVDGLFKEFNAQYMTAYIPDEPIPMAKIRCSFFDWVSELYGIDVIVASFAKKSPSYLGNNSKNLCDRFEISYPEIQVCVYNNTVIHKKTIESGV